MFSTGAFSACLVRQISPSSASILSQSRTGGQPGNDNDNSPLTVVRHTGHDDCVWFFLVLTETSDAIERPMVIVNRIYQARMFFVAEFLHVQVQKRLPLDLWRLLLPRSHSEVEAIQTSAIQFTGKRYRGFFLEENKGKAFFQSQPLNLSRILISY